MTSADPDLAADDPAVTPPIVGLHHVRLPVSDVLRSRDWYIAVFGFEPLMLVEEEDRVVGVVLVQRSGLTLGLHDAPELARALEGFCPIALSVAAVDDLRRWCDRFDALGVGHALPCEGHLGWYVAVPDPDGLVIELHTLDQPAADEA